MICLLLTLVTEDPHGRLITTERHAERVVKSGDLEPGCLVCAT